MPKEIKEIKEFMTYITDKVAASDAKKNKKAPENKPKAIFKKKLIYKKSAKNGKAIHKLKLRTKKQLITYIAKDEATVKKIMSGLPGTIEKIDLSQKKDSKKKAASKK